MTGYEHTEADRLDKVVTELIAHGHDELPDGPAPLLGVEPETILLTSRSESEVQRLATLGKALVDQRLAARNSRNLKTN